MNKNPDLLVTRAINVLMDFYQVRTEAKLLKLMGLHPTAFSEWKRKNQINWNVIFEKFTYGHDLIKIICKILGIELDQFIVNEDSPEVQLANIMQTEVLEENKRLQAIVNYQTELIMKLAERVK